MRDDGESRLLTWVQSSPPKSISQMLVGICKPIDRELGATDMQPERRDVGRISGSEIRRPRRAIGAVVIGSSRGQTGLLLCPSPPKRTRTSGAGRHPVCGYSQIAHGAASSNQHTKAIGLESKPHGRGEPAMRFG